MFWFVYVMSSSDYRALVAAGQWEMHRGFQCNPNHRWILSDMCHVWFICCDAPRQFSKSWWCHQMETFCRVIGPLCEEFTSDRWILLTKASDAEFSLICAWINGWVNYREAGDLRRYLVTATSLGCVYDCLHSPVYHPDENLPPSWHDKLCIRAALRISRMSLLLNVISGNLRLHYITQQIP